MNELLYLNTSHLDALDLGMSDIVDILEEVFRHKAAGETRMPPKMFFYTEGDRFLSAMGSACAPLGYAGAKWQSGNPENPVRGLPYIQGLYVLNEHESGRMVAILDSKWITAKRTAAASALVARYQARAGARVMALLGCGVQGRAHLEAMTAEVASLTVCRVYDTVPARQRAFVEETDGRFGGVRVEGAASAEVRDQGRRRRGAGRSHHRGAAREHRLGVGRAGRPGRRHRLRLLCDRRVHRSDGHRNHRRSRADRGRAGNARASSSASPGSTPTTRR